MPVAETFKTYLDDQGVDHEVLLHSHTGSSMETAQAAHIPGDRLAKAVVFSDERGYLMVVVPSDHHVDLDSLRRRIHRQLNMVSEQELATLFPDCEVGAIPALGAAYGVEMIWDSALAREPEVYFEGGDHRVVVRVQGQEFRTLMANARQGLFSHHL